MTWKRKIEIDRTVFASTDRGNVSMDDVEAAMRQVLPHPARPVVRSPRVKTARRRRQKSVDDER